METGYAADLLTRHSIDFIEAHRARPFFLYLPHLAIHFPWQGPDDPPHRQKGVNYSRDKWGTIPDRGNVAPHVQAMVESLDRSVGQVMATLRRLGLEQDTMVIFTSDNGGYIDYAPDFRQISSNGVFRGQKTEIYEGGHRVPLIVSWPGRIRPGVSDGLTHSNDWMPTLLRLADPKAEPTRGDGLNLLPHLLQGEPLPVRTLFWRARKGHAVRRGPWKLCVTSEKSALFHLGDDPGETTDRAGMEPAIVRELSAAWANWNEDVNRSAAEFGR
jgi:arylsulfatase A-like enzyme